MEGKIKDKLKQILLQILSENRRLNIGIREIANISKGLILIEYFDDLRPTGELMIQSSEERSDGHNKTTNMYTLKLRRSGAEMYSYHTFSEAFGVSQESHKQVVYPEDSYEIQEILISIADWTKGFMKAASSSLIIKENLRGVKIVD